jgi:molybdate transport system substrate-binding protein
MLRRTLLAAVFAGLSAPVAAQEAPIVAAASDLQSALPEIAAAFQTQTGLSVRLTFAASGTLTQQIQNGAPYQVFLSADEDYVRRLQAAGRTDGAGQLYAIGRLGIFTPRGSALKADAGLRDLKVALGDGRLTRFAIANPDHAPYGRAAREALQTAGLWDAIRPRLVLGENVSQAGQFAVSGSAQGGLIPLSLASTPQVKAAGTFALLPAAMHKPLRQRAVVLRGAGPTARAFYDFLGQAEARAVLARYGFASPGR